MLLTVSFSTFATSLVALSHSLGFQALRVRANYTYLSMEIIAATQRRHAVDKSVCP